AEDGIRDFHVTGVQTCALPICTEGHNQHGVPVLSYCRWVMVRKRDPAAPPVEAVVPQLATSVAPDDLVLPPGLDFTGYDFALAEIGRASCRDGGAASAV